MNKFNSFTLIAAIVMTSSTSFGQTGTNFQGSHDALANQIRSQAYSRLSNMGVEMPPMAQHSFDHQAVVTPHREVLLPTLPQPTPAIRPMPQSKFQLWNPFSWFSSRNCEREVVQQNFPVVQHVTPVDSMTYANTHTSSPTGSASVSVSGTGGSSMAVSNVNGSINVKCSYLCDGQQQKIELKGSKSEIQSQVQGLPQEVSQQILDAIGN